MPHSSKVLFFISLTIASIISGGLLFFIWQSSVEGANLDYVFADFLDGEKVELGRGIYQTQCAACHGVNLEGEENWETRRPDGTMPAPPQNEMGHTWEHPDSLTFDTIKFGGKIIAGKNRQSNMPAFEDILSDEDIMNTLAFIKSTWPEEMQSYNVGICKALAKRS